MPRAGKRGDKSTANLDNTVQIGCLTILGLGERLELEVVDEPVNGAVAQVNAEDCDEALAEVDDDERIRSIFFCDSFRVGA